MRKWWIGTAGVALVAMGGASNLLKQEPVSEADVLPKIDADLHTQSTDGAVSSFGTILTGSNSHQSPSEDQANLKSNSPMHVDTNDVGEKHHDEGNDILPELAEKESEINWDMLEAEAEMADRGYENIESSHVFIGAEIPSDGIANLVSDAVGFEMDTKYSQCLFDIFEQEAQHNISQGGSNKVRRAVGATTQSAMFLDFETDTYKNHTSISQRKTLGVENLWVLSKLSFPTATEGGGAKSIIFNSMSKLNNGQIDHRIAESYSSLSEAETAELLMQGDNINVYNDSKAKFSRLISAVNGCLALDGASVNTQHFDNGNFLEGPSPN